MTSINNQYGFPFLTRISEIEEKTEGSQIQYPLEVMGKYQGLRQIRVRIGLPIYRIENGRTRTFQKEYLATHPDARTDLFIKDTESLETQRAQHEILKKLASDEDLLKEFQEGTEQTEPLIITSAGIVVNGNRRLCVWRTLYYDAPEKYKHFEYIDVAVLPDDCDEKEIKELEKRLQIQKTHRAEYKWHNKAAMLKEERESGISPESLAKSYDISKKDVDLLIGAYEYAEIYLKGVNKEDQWSLVDADEYAFKTMVEERKKLSDQGRKELFESICFKLIETKDYQGRLYGVIPDIAANLEVISERLLSENNTVIPKGIISLPDKNIPAISEDDVDLLGGTITKKSRHSELAALIQKEPIPLGKLIKQVTEEQKALKEEKKNSKYLLSTLSKVSQQLWNVRSCGLNEGTEIEGVQDQLLVINEHIAAIKKWLVDRCNC